jgi:hypothetical protein
MSSQSTIPKNVPVATPIAVSKTGKTIDKIITTGTSNMGYVISLVIAIALAVVASISNIVNDSMSLATALTFLYIISQFVIDNYVGDRCKGKGTVLRPILGTCSIFLLSWMAIAFFNIYFVPKVKNKDEDDNSQRRRQ